MKFIEINDGYSKEPCLINLEHVTEIAIGQREDTEKTGARVIKPRLFYYISAEEDGVQANRVEDFETEEETHLRYEEIKSIVMRKE